jgi:hypothetical protein
MVVNVSPQVETFVSHYSPAELREIRVCLESERDDLKNLYKEQGNLTIYDLMILERIKKVRKEIRIQILAKIEEILDEEEAA